MSAGEAGCPELSVGVGDDVVAGPALLPHRRVGPGGAVVAGAEPVVERDVGLAVVALEVAVVELVEIGARGDPGGPP